VKDPDTRTNIALDELPNLGKTTVMWLRAIGIRDSQTLSERGIFWAYERMRARGFRVTTAVLFSLEGALQDRPWRSFDEAEKAALLEQLAAADLQDSARALPKSAPRHSESPKTATAAATTKSRAGPARAARKPTRSARPRLVNKRTETQV